MKIGEGGTGTDGGESNGLYGGYGGDVGTCLGILILVKSSGERESLVPV